MTETPLRIGTLVLYKNRLARVADIGKKKLTIEDDAGQKVSIRPKDVTLLHPGPVLRLAELRTPEGEPMEAWELLAGSTTTLEELAELAYGDYTPDSAWATWQLVSQGDYFSGTVDEVQVLSAEAVAEQEAARAAKAAEEEAWNLFVARVESGSYLPDDEQYLNDVVQLAYEQREQSRTMRALGRQETPQNAHALLLHLGYWDSSVNPYPERFGVPTTGSNLTLPALPDEDRRDLTHMQAWAIDDEGNRDPDDAISLHDGVFWVHVADPAAVVSPGDEVDVEASARGSNLYLPEGTISMLPPQATLMLGLGLAEISPALSFGMQLDESGQISELDITPSWVRVTRMTYAEADSQLDESPLRELYAVTQRFEERRLQNGAIELTLPEVKLSIEEDGTITIRPLPPLRSRMLVRDAMLMAGEAVARFAVENEIPVPFSVQDAPNVDDPAQLLVETTADMFGLRRYMKPGRRQSEPDRHSGLGLDLYTQTTSPLRRYLDLVTHQQIRAHLRGEPVMDSSTLTERIGAVSAVTGGIRRAERLSLAHWTLVYLIQNPQWQGEGIVVDRRGNRHFILIPELGFETPWYGQEELPLDSIVQLEVTNVNLPELEAFFRIVD